MSSPNTILTATLEMEAIQRLIPEGLPVSIQVVVATLFLGLIYSLITAERPFAGFPVVTVNGQSPTKSWMWHGKEALDEGLQRVRLNANAIQQLVANEICSSPAHFK